MPAISTAIAAVGLGLAAGGAVMQYEAGKKQQEGQQQVLAAEQSQIAAQKQQRELDAMRRKREIVRQSLAARAQSLATATNQNAAQGSALQGAYGGISGQTGVNYLGVTQNEALGEQIYGAKFGMLQGYQTAASAQSLNALGAGLGSLGGGIMKNIGTISKVGTYFGSGATDLMNFYSKPGLIGV